MAFQSLVLVVVLLIFPFITNGQFQPYPYFTPGEDGTAASPTGCLAQYNSANASGTYDLGPSFVNGLWFETMTSREDLSWGITVSQNSSSGEYDSNLWLGTPPGALSSPFLSTIEANLLRH